jgi:hypothetical protein
VVPVAVAPLLGSVVSLLIVALIGAFIASDRLAGVIPQRRARLLVALFFVVLPTTYMTLGSITFIQFYFAVFLVAVAVSEPAKSHWAALTTYAAVVLAVGTGPFGVLFIPLFGVRWLMRRDRYSTLLLLAVGVPALVQAIVLFSAGRPAAASPTTDPMAVLQIISGHAAVVLFGGRPISRLLESGISTPVIYALGGVALAIVALQLSTLSRRWILVILYVVAVVVVPALIVGSDDTALLLDPLSASRYVVIVTAILGGALIVSLARRRRRIVGVVAAAILLVGVVGDFVLKPYPDSNWPETSACIGGASPCVVPIFPGGVWDIQWPGSESVTAP